MTSSTKPAIVDWARITDIYAVPLAPATPFSHPSHPQLFSTLHLTTLLDLGEMRFNFTLLIASVGMSLLLCAGTALAAPEFNGFMMNQFSEVPAGSALASPRPNSHHHHQHHAEIPAERLEDDKRLDKRGGISFDKVPRGTGPGGGADGSWNFFPPVHKNGMKKRSLRAIDYGGLPRPDHGSSPTDPGQLPNGHDYERRICYRYDGCRRDPPPHVPDHGH